MIRWTWVTLTRMAVSHCRCQPSSRTNTQTIPSIDHWENASNSDLQIDPITVTITDRQRLVSRRCRKEDRSMVSPSNSGEERPTVNLSISKEVQPTANPSKEHRPTANLFKEHRFTLNLYTSREEPPTRSASRHSRRSASQHPIRLTIIRSASNRCHNREGRFTCMVSLPISKEDRNHCMLGVLVCYYVLYSRRHDCA